ncbi:uncharacterized mitochondrial protein AtMg00810-like [Prosopis cineraria]|uniref:uncharacterized mitochondrial protein AtMg00810-like n=1 Tax=Prosopis cineraria TaxID=364024 RepID=UPI00240EF370|nr:uncharacterized mitochondrial protein AtMg00810-like [Prosopis cineraria]
MFVKVEGSKKCILIIYVDDIILTGDHLEEIERVKAALGNEFEVKDLERVKAALGNEFEVKDLQKLRYFLGMEVAKLKKGIYVSQRKYILDLLTETGMLGCRPVETPIEVKKLKKKPKDKNRKEKDFEELGRKIR